MSDEDQTMQVNDGANGSKVVRVNYPGNSNKAKAEQSAVSSKQPEKRVEKVISGEAHERKKGLGRKIAETFAGDRVENVGNYVLFDVVLPQIKSLISDVVTQSIERALFGDNTRSRYNSRGGNFVNRPSGGYTSYNRYSSPTGRAGEADSPRQGASTSRRSGDYTEIVLDSRGDADAVLDGMSELISKYQMVSVSDLNEMVGITGQFTDEKWGWFNIRGASVRRLNGGGYMLDLPKPEPLDK